MVAPSESVVRVAGPGASRSAQRGVAVGTAVRALGDVVQRSAT